MSVKPSLNRLSIIDKSLTLDGSVSFSGELIVEGTIKGSMRGEHIIIAESGQIKAETQARNITISGVFEGSLTVKDKLILRSGGRCSGTVTCRDLEMEAGSILDGEIQCGPR